MKIQMNKILLLCAIVMLSLEVVGGAQCQGCYDVKPDNTCKHTPFVCTIGRRGFCFLRRIQKRGEITKVSRGCTSHCRTGVVSWPQVDVYTWCCTADDCNLMNAWY